MKDLELFTKAREVYEKIGYAKGDYVDADGNVCALGALGIALNINPILSYVMIDQRICDYLNDEAHALYGDAIAEVNDKLGRDAVLHVYDNVIKRVEHDNGK